MFDLPTGWPRTISLVAVAVFFVVGGVAHFMSPDVYVAMMPPYLPAHLELVYVSGFFEILGGTGVVLGRTRQVAGYGLIALLVAVYPANIHMALHPETFASAAMPEWGLYARLPLQFVVMAWVYWSIRRPAERVS